MPRTRDEARVGKARALASEGSTRAEIAAALGVSQRTVSRWLHLPPGRPRLPAGEGSRWTRRRRERED